MTTTLSQAWVTFSVTLMALVLSGYFGLRRQFFLMAVCLICFFTLLTPSIVFGGELCKPTLYADGDTFTYFVQTSGELRKVRVKGFDAPERGQPFSKQATNKLRELTEDGADCECHKLDKYGRSLCTVRTLSGENVATVMLRAGFGCIDPRFEKESTEQDRVQATTALSEAQTAKRGMWAQHQVQCGFDYRRMKYKLIYTN